MIFGLFLIILVIFAHTMSSISSTCQALFYFSHFTHMNCFRLKRQFCYSLSLLPLLNLLILLYDFRIGPAGLRVSSAILFTKEQRKETFKSRKKFNEFSKLSTKSCMSRTMNNLKESFTFMKTTTNKTTRICVTLYVV